MNKQAKFSYSPLGKAFEKQIKTIEDQGEKQVDALNTLKSNNKKLTIEDMTPESALINNHPKKELDKIKQIEKTVDREKLVYKTNEYKYSFEDFQTIKTFGRDIYNGTITLEKAKDYQNDLIDKIMSFNRKTKPKCLKKKQEKEIILENLHNFYDGREKILNASKSKIFSIKSKGSGILNTDVSKLKILIPKQML